MKIEELLIESKNYNLQEGPGWDTAKGGLKQTASGIGNVAKGVGNVLKGAGKGALNLATGAAQSIGRGAGAFKRGWDQGKAGDFQGLAGDLARSVGGTVSKLTPADQTAAEPAKTTAKKSTKAAAKAPAKKATKPKSKAAVAKQQPKDQQPAVAATPTTGRIEPTVGDVTQMNKPTTQPAAVTANDINKQGPAGTDTARVTSPQAQQALQKTAQATAGADVNKIGQTLYAQVKGMINQLDKKGKQRILNVVQKSIAQTPSTTTAKAPTGTPKLSVQQGGKVKAPAAKTGTGESVESKKKVVVEFYSNFLGRKI